MKWYASLILNIVHYFRVLVVWITSPLFVWKFDSRKDNVPSPQSTYVMKSAVELAHLIRKREVSTRTSSKLRHSF